MPRQAKDNCANPLLRDWIGEWMEQARGHHTKAYYTYKKAYESISKCPIPFNHPSEAKMVKGIGDGMVARLEKRMAKYCQENGLPMPTRASGSGSGSKRAGEQLDDASQESGKRQRRAPRTYVPRYRSGSYAILLALSQQSEEFNQQCATKEEIIRIAQNHCNSSFDMPEPGRNYTAWNSIKTLINKGYVWKQGNPPKYMLTESGVEMASHLKNTLHNGGSIHASQSRTSSSQRNLMEEEDGDDEEEEEEEIDLSLYVLDPEKCRNDTQHSEMASAPAASTSRASQSQSAMNFNPATLSMSQSSFDNDILLSTQPDSTQPNESKKQTNKDYDYDEGTDDIIFLDCLPSPPAAHVPSTSANLPLSSTPSTPSSALNDSQPIQSDASLVFEYTYLDLRGNPTRHASQALADIDASTNGLMYQIRFSSKQRTHPKAQNLRRVKQEANGTLTGYISEFDADIICPGLPPEPVLPLREKEGQDDDFWPRRKIIPSSQGQSSRSQEISSLLSLSQLQNEPLSQDPNEDVSFPPGSYEIVLVLDNREIKMKSNRDYFQEQLIEKGVPIVKRALELGDVIWVARKRGSKSPGDELFLDLVIERKRMDDLVASIKDGRFHEQKYRLHQSGAKKVIYIVEEYNKEAAVQFGAQAIQTAMSSTQVVDGFFLKRTASIDDTIEYLVTLNTMVQKMYEGVTLYRIPEHKVSRQNYLEFKKKLDKHHLISYPLYNRLNSKTGTMTLHDIYLRMLMTIRGVSAEKAMALARVYPTPVSLLRAFSGTNEQEGKKLAQNATKDGINRRRWNNPLSERLYKVWGQLDYEDA